MKMLLSDCCFHASDIFKHLCILQSSFPHVCLFFSWTRALFHSLQDNTGDHSALTEGGANTLDVPGIRKLQFR